MELFIILSSFFILSGLVYGLYKTRELHIKQRKLHEKKQVLKLMQKHSKLTPSMLALKTDISIDDAEKMLEEISRDLSLEPLVTEEGKIYYSLEQKLTDKLPYEENLLD